MFAPPLLAAAGLEEEELNLQLCELALAPPPPPQERFSPPQHAANAFATVFIIIQHISVLFDLRDIPPLFILDGIQVTNLSRETLCFLRHQLIKLHSICRHQLKESMKTTT